MQRTATQLQQKNKDFTHSELKLKLFTEIIQPNQILDNAILTKTPILLSTFANINPTLLKIDYKIKLQTERSFLLFFKKICPKLKCLNLAQKADLVSILKLGYFSSLSYSYLLKIVLLFINDFKPLEIDSLTKSASSLYFKKSAQYKLAFLDLIIKLNELGTYKKIVVHQFVKFRDGLYCFDERIKIKVLELLLSVLKYLSIKTLKNDYAVLIDQLIDDDASVLLKIAAVHCIKQICARIPNHVIYYSFGSSRKNYLLCDFIFILCCRLLNDYDPELKIQILDIILDLEHFSEVYAQNSITKNIMSNLIKITSSSNNSAVEKLSTFAGDKKNEFRKKVDRSMKLYKIGCLSAIINVMEDEVVEIRIKAIEVLRKIANMHFSCHSMAANLMMDSLGDDDLSVRLTALNSLRSNDNEKLILTSDDQLVDLISLSQESSYEIRKRVRQCLQLLKMNNPQSILHILKAFKETFMLYPNDFYEILECISMIGSMNDAHVRYHFEDITGNDNYFDGIEPVVDDKKYVLEFIMLINSLKTVKNSAIKLPMYFNNHISYFAGAYREYMPDIFCVSSSLNNDEDNDDCISSAAKRAKYSNVPYLKNSSSLVDYYLMAKNIKKSSKIDRNLLQDLKNQLSKFESLIDNSNNSIFKFIYSVIGLQVKFIKELDLESEFNFDELSAPISWIFSNYCSSDSYHFKIILLCLLFQYLIARKVNSNVNGSLYIDLLEHINKILKSNRKIFRSAEDFIVMIRKELNSDNWSKKFILCTLYRFILMLVISLDSQSLKKTYFDKFVFDSEHKNCDGEIIFSPKHGFSVSTSFSPVNLIKDNNLAIKFSLKERDLQEVLKINSFVINSNFKHSQFDFKTDLTFPSTRFSHTTKLTAQIGEFYSIADVLKFFGFNNSSLELKELEFLYKENFTPISDEATISVRPF